MPFEKEQKKSQLNPVVLIPKVSGGEKKDNSYDTQLMRSFTSFRPSAISSTAAWHDIRLTTPSVCSVGVGGRGGAAMTLQSAVEPL